jgi:hypothetical protein
LRGALHVAILAAWLIRIFRILFVRHFNLLLVNERPASVTNDWRGPGKVRVAIAPRGRAQQAVHAVEPVADSAMFHGDLLAYVPIQFACRPQTRENSENCRTWGVPDRLAVTVRQRRWVAPQSGKKPDPAAC